MAIKDPEKRRAARRILMAALRAKNPEKVREQVSKAHFKLRANPTFRISRMFGMRVWRALKYTKPSIPPRTIEIMASLGYTLENLVQHLENQFVDGMTWENKGKWHIDHIRPVSSFNYNSMEDPGFKECWGLSNLRPLWAKDNLKKITEDRQTITLYRQLNENTNTDNPS